MRASCKHKFQMQQQQRRRIKLKSSQGSSSTSLPFFFLFVFLNRFFIFSLSSSKNDSPPLPSWGAGQLCWPGRCGNRCLPTFWRTLLAKLLAYKLLICQKRRRLTVATNFHCLLWITPSNGISHKMQNKLEKKKKNRISVEYNLRCTSRVVSQGQQVKCSRKTLSNKHGNISSLYIILADFISSPNLALIPAYFAWKFLSFFYIFGY